MIRRRIFTVLKYVFLFTAALLSVFPLLWMAVSATNQSVDVVTGRLLPAPILWRTSESLQKTTTSAWRCGTPSATP